MFNESRKISVIQILIIVVLLFFTSFYLYKSYIDSSKDKSDKKGWTVIKPPSEISAIALQGDFLWAGGKDGLYKIEVPSGKLLIQPEKNSSMKYVRAILVDKNNNLWVGHDNGLSCFDGKKWRHITHNEGLPDNKVNALAIDLHGKVWAGTWGGAVVIENNKLKVLTSKDGLIDDMVNVILPDTKGGMWFGSYIEQQGGVSYLGKDGKWQYFKTANGLPHSYVTSICQDTKGDVWIGCGLLDKGGAIVLGESKDKWVIKRTITKNDGLCGEKVRSIFQDRNGIMWLGSEYDGVTVLYNDKWSIFTTQDGLSDNEIKATVQDDYGNLWFATRDGITKLKLSDIDNKK